MIAFLSRGVFALLAGERGPHRFNKFTIDRIDRCCRLQRALRLYVSTVNSQTAYIYIFIIGKTIFKCNWFSLTRILVTFASWFVLIHILSIMVATHIQSNEFGHPNLQYCCDVIVVKSDSTRRRYHIPVLVFLKLAKVSLVEFCLW